MDCLLPGSSIHRTFQASPQDFPAHFTGVGCRCLLRKYWVDRGYTDFMVVSSRYTVKLLKSSVSSVQLLSHIWLFATPWTAACQASLSITNSWSLLKLMSIKLMMPSNHLILCRLLLFPPSIFPSIKVFCFFFFPPVSSSHQVAKVLKFQLLYKGF